LYKIIWNIGANSLVNFFISAALSMLQWSGRLVSQAWSSVCVYVYMYVCCEA